MARSAGALTVALVNDTDSPLARAAEAVLPIGAGPELSVAATKTFVATLAALLRLTAAWTGDRLHRGGTRSAARPACRGDDARLERGGRYAVAGEQPGQHRARDRRLRSRAKPR